MIIYILLIGLCLFGQFFVNSKNKKYYFEILVLLCTMVSAFRFQVGQDYQHVTDVYNWIANGYDVYVEFGYKLMNEIILFIPFFNEKILYIITSFFIIIMFGIFIKRTVSKEYWLLSLFLFITTGIYFASMNLVRQYMAIAICLLAILKLDRAKNIQFVILTFIAITFHTSALIMFAFALFYILLKKTNSTTIMWIIYSLSLVFIIIDLRQLIEFFSFLIPDRWKWYLDSNFLNDRNTSAIVKQLIPNIIVVYSIVKNKELKKHYDKFDISFALIFMSTIITNCFYGILVLLRLSNYFDFGFLIIIPIIFDYLVKYDKKIKLSKFYIISIIVYYLLLTVMTIFIMNGHGVMPYKTIF